MFGCTGDIKCHICKADGHLMKDCPNKHTFIVQEDNVYSSANDLDEETQAMLVANHVGDMEEHEEIHINVDISR